ncbi:MAG: hypothetical protein M0010_05230 [Actinomycetota bacterium]|nr:hypothetical protein [Actinomycetota bacterium]
MKQQPCHSARSTSTTRVTVTVDIHPHPMLERLAGNMLCCVLGELAADGIHATTVAVTINGYNPVHPWAP